MNALHDTIKDLEKKVRSAGGNPDEIYKAAGIPSNDPHLEQKISTQIEKLAAISYAAGRLANGQVAQPGVTTQAETRKAIVANPMTELDQLCRLIEAGKADEAKAFTGKHRAALIEQRDGCLQMVRTQLAQEKNSEKKAGLSRLAKQLREIPI